jgi:parallel beta-helix repeat protein
MVANDPSAAATNTNVLQTIVNIAQTTDCTNGRPYGATILIPGHSAVPGQTSDGHDNGAVYYLQAVPGSPSPTPAIVIDCNWPLRFLGTGNSELSMLLDVSNNSSDMFSLFTTGTATQDLGPNTGGITFEDLSLSYANIATSEKWAAIHTIPDPSDASSGGAQNVRLVRVVLKNCPIGAWFERALQPSMLQCTIVYANNVATAGVMIGNGTNEGDEGSGKEVYIAGCIFSASIAGCTGMYIQGCEHVRVDNCEIDGFLYGILIKPGPYGENALRCTFTAVTIYATCSNSDMESGFQGSAVIIQPQGPDVAVGQIVFTSCFFEASDTGAPTTGTGSVPAVFVDAEYGTIDTVRFVSCYSTRWTGPGLYIQGGVVDDATYYAANIEVLGGMYAGNNYTSDGFSASQPYGIYVGEYSQGVRIVGASCVGEYKWITLHRATNSMTQGVGIYVDGGASQITIDGCDVRSNADYGIVVNAASDVIISGCNVSSNAVGGSGAGVQVNNGATNVVIDGCDVTNNGTNGIQVNGTSGAVAGVFIRNCNASGYSSYSTAIDVTGPSSNVPTVEITNCAGYNGVYTSALTTTLPGSGSAFHGYDHGYYGPVSFFVGTNTEVTAIEINGITTGLKTGSFVLYPQQSGVITYTGGGIAPTFVMIGQ